MARAFVTALSHEDAATRQRAEQRVDRWQQVLAGMASGALKIGSRAPVAGLPAWVTPEVVRGGFATGTARAGGPLQPYETDAARRAGIPADRRALFGYYLTDPWAGRVVRDAGLGPVCGDGAGGGGTASGRVAAAGW
jgi:hypothetical protein